MSYLDDYYQAVDRMLQAKNKITKIGTKITQSSVAIEAGRTPGSIKKSREVYHDLIEHINSAQVKQLLIGESNENAVATIASTSVIGLRDKLKNEKKKTEEFRLKYEAALARELMLVHRVYKLEGELVKERAKPTLSVVNREKP